MADRTVSRAAEPDAHRSDGLRHVRFRLAVSLEAIALVGGDRLPGASPHAVGALFGLQAASTAAWRSASYDSRSVASAGSGTSLAGPAMFGTTNR